jgi:hypothetical protein
MKTKILFTFLVVFNLGVKGQISTKHMVLYQTFYNHSNDVSGQNNSVQGINISYSTDRVGRPNSSCHFNGNSVVLNSTTLTPNGVILITSFWFKTSSTNEMCLMNYENLFVGIKNGKLLLKVGDSISTTPINYNDDKYHNVMFVSDLTGCGIKIDSSNNLSFRDIFVRGGNGVFSFGSSLVNTFKYTGEMDDILIYSFKVDMNTVVPDLDKIYQYKSPVFNGFTYTPDLVPNFKVKGKYLQSDGGVTNVVFNGGSQNPITVLNDSVVQTNVPFNVQDGLVMLVKGYDTTYSPVPFPEDTTTTGTNDVYERNEIQIYPNPSNGTFRVQNTSKTPLQLEIINVLGERIFVTESNEDVLIQGLLKGVYFVRVNKVSKKILVE